MTVFCKNTDISQKPEAQMHLANQTGDKFTHTRLFRGQGFAASTATIHRLKLPFRFHCMFAGGRCGAGQTCATGLLNHRRIGGGLIECMEDIPESPTVCRMHHASCSVEDTMIVVVTWRYCQRFG